MRSVGGVEKERHRERERDIKKQTKERKRERERKRKRKERDRKSEREREKDRETDNERKNQACIVSTFSVVFVSRVKKMSWNVHMTRKTKRRLAKAIPANPSVGLSLAKEIIASLFQHVPHREWGPQSRAQHQSTRPFKLQPDQSMPALSVKQ